jgi:hypothetical protein
VSQSADHEKAKMTASFKRASTMRISLLYAIEEFFFFFFVF